MHSGTITVFTGPMRSRKTLEIILIALEADLAGKSVVAFYPSESERWGKINEISSRIKAVTTDTGEEKPDVFVSYPAHPLSRDMAELVEYIDDLTEIVVIDDAQFFGMGIIPLVQKLRQQGIHVYISGLDMDYLKQPFGPMPFLMSIADEIYKRTAICDDCGAPARASFRITNDSGQVVVGDAEYAVCCHYCYNERVSRAFSKTQHLEPEDVEL